MSRILVAANQCWNCINTGLGCGVSKSPHLFHFLKGDQSNAMTRNFHKIFFQQRRRINEGFKEQRQVLFYLKCIKYDKKFAMSQRISAVSTTTYATDKLHNVHMFEMY